MKADIRKVFRAIKWTTEHTLTPEQRKQLFLNKLERARLASQALRTREGQVRAR